MLTMLITSLSLITLGMAKVWVNSRQTPAAGPGPDMMGWNGAETVGWDATDEIGW